MALTPAVQQIEDDLRALRASGWWNHPSTVVDELVLRALDKDMTQKRIAELLGCSVTSMSKRARRVRETRNPGIAAERLERHVFWLLRCELPPALRVQVVVNLVERIGALADDVSEEQRDRLRRACGDAIGNERPALEGTPNPEEVADLVVRKLISAGAALATLQALGRAD